VHYRSNISRRAIKGGGFAAGEDLMRTAGLRVTPTRSFSSSRKQVLYLDVKRERERSERVRMGERERGERERRERDRRGECERERERGG
jgi:hypothetical protein